MSILHAILLGIIEGITEFLPISSTGHLVLADRFLGLTSTGTFKVLIQLGAILAIITVYFAKLWKILVDLPKAIIKRDNTGYARVHLPCLEALLQAGAPSRRQT